MRHDFNQRTKDTLARRAGMRCSNPGCRKPTAGPAVEPTNSVNIGVAAHITAASEGGPRYDDSSSSEHRSSIQNGVWLCQNCAKLIDSDASRYRIEILHGWKKVAEQLAHNKLEANETRVATPQPVQELVTITEIRAAAIIELMDQHKDEALQEYRIETAALKKKNAKTSSKSNAEPPTDLTDLLGQMVSGSGRSYRWSGYENESAVIAKLDGLKERFLTLHTQHAEQLLLGNAIGAHELVGEIHSLTEKYNRTAHPPYPRTDFGTRYCLILPSREEMAKSTIAAHDRYPGIVPLSVFDNLSPQYQSLWFVHGDEPQNLRKALEWERVRRQKLFERLASSGSGQPR